MHRGRIVEEGPSGRVLEAPRETYTKELIAAIPHFGAAAAQRVLSSA